jgi:hypothetical protein
MNTLLSANHLIEAYVADVAVRLPRKQRNDVAFELRALLQEELQAKAEAAGRATDDAMAMDLLRGFGRPEDVAARYRPTLTIIDPSDGRSFLFATAVGLLLIWSLGLLTALRETAQGDGWLLNVLSHWWNGTVLSSPWWPGVLVVGYAWSAWVRRRWPQASTWTPRPADRIVGGRAAMAMGLIGILCGVAILIDPRRILDVVWGGNAAPVAYTALTYTDSFLQGPAFVLLALIAVNIPLFIAVMAKGRWSPALRRIETAFGLATCAAMLWAVADGPIFLSEHSDQTAKVLMAAIVALTLIYYAVRAYRRVNPNPGAQAWR